MRKTTWTALAFFALSASAVIAAEFTLELEKSGRIFGPFKFQDGEAVNIGTHTFTLRTDAAVKNNASDKEKSETEGKSESEEASSVFDEVEMQESQDDCTIKELQINRPQMIGKIYKIKTGASYSFTATDEESFTIMFYDSETSLFKQGFRFPNEVIEDYSELYEKKKSAEFYFFVGETYNLAVGERKKGSGDKIEYTW